MKNIIIVSTLFLITQVVVAQKSFLPPPVNSILYNESNPVLGGQGNTMLFLSESSQEPVPSWSITYGHDIRWNTSVSLDALNYSNKTIKNISPSLNFDENKIFFSSNRFGGIGSGDIWLINKNGTTWDAKPTNLGMPLNSSEYESDPYFAPDDKTLFFVRYNSNKTTDGKPCGDIYTSTINGSGSWSTPVKLPAPINSGFEAKPVMLNDNRTLLFASQRAGGLGSFDVYMSRLNDLNSWSEPEPLVFLNTNGDDSNFSVPGVGNMLYAAYKNKQSLDIARYIVPEKFLPLRTQIINTKVVEKGTTRGVSAKLKITNIATKTNKDYLLFAEKNTRLFLHKANQYELVFSSLDGKLLHQTFYKDLNELAKFDNKTLIVELTDSIVKENMYFSKFIESGVVNPLYENELKRIATECKMQSAKVLVTVNDTSMVNDSLKNEFKIKLDKYLNAPIDLDFINDAQNQVIKLSDAVLRFAKE